jgi:HlyD family secretion protein
LAQATALVATAQASVDEAEKALKRALELQTTNNVAQSALDIAQRNRDMARAELNRTLGVQKQAQAGVDKTLIRAPIAGIILKKQVSSGQAVSTMPPTPIAIVADMSSLRVRAEVDEFDIGRVTLGQRTLMKLDAFPDMNLTGTVVRINRRMGPRSIQTDRSIEKNDNRVLQVLVDLDKSAVSLPSGLRVDVFFLKPEAKEGARQEK